MIEAPTHGWVSARTLIGLALAVVLLGAFVAWELRQAAPLLDPRVFAQRSLSAGSLTIFIQFVAFFGYTFVVLQYLQFVRGDTPLAAAIQVLPLALALMPTSRLAPRLTARFGARWVCGAGLALLAGGLAIMAQLHSDSADVRARQRAAHDPAARRVARRRRVGHLCSACFMAGAWWRSIFPGTDCPTRCRTAAARSASTPESS